MVDREICQYVLSTAVHYDEFLRDIVTMTNLDVDLDELGTVLIDNIAIKQDIKESIESFATLYSDRGSSPNGLRDAGILKAALIKLTNNIYKEISKQDLYDVNGVLNLQFKQWLGKDLVLETPF